jgi:hypothetical protein
MDLQSRQARFGSGGLQLMDQMRMVVTVAEDIGACNEL